MPDSESDGHGWDKGARLREKRLENREERRFEPLQPDFPWEMVPFDADFFEVDFPGSIDSVEPK